jgi:hypothetical protein
MALRLASLALLSFFLLRAQSDVNLLSSEDVPDTPPPVTCPAGAPIGAVHLQVRSLTSPDPLPFQSINHLSEGDTVLYSPIEHGAQKRPGEVALVMVPAKHKTTNDFLIVTDPKPASKRQEWKIPQTISLAAFVYGPQGLSRKKVQGFLSQDDQLIAQLADYADKTSQTEALLAALSDNASSAAGMNSALNGFASQYGLSVQIDKNAPPAAQAQTLFATMNPQLATYDPLSSSTAGRVAQTASVATAAATLFFGSPIGLAAGGTAMLLDLRSIAFPGTQFRSSFAQQLPMAGLNLCGQRGAAPPHTRVAFIWASRIPNIAAPSIHIAASDYIPQTQKTPVPVEVAAVQWKYLQRSRAWALENDKGQKTPVTVLKLGNQRAIEIDLEKTKAPPGDYKLTGFWDWAPFQAIGEIHVRPLSTFTNAEIEAASQNQLLAHSGKVPVTVEGGDFEFTGKVEFKKVGDEFAVPEPVRFILPKGLRAGPQDSMDVQIDTTALDPGKYALLVSQQDGKAHPLALNILPNPPRVANLPILVNQGAATQHYVLKGVRLDLLSKLEAPGAKFDLGATTAGGAERNVDVALKSNLQPGATVPIRALCTDRTAAFTWADALQITGPLPVIASSKLSLPGGMAIAILPDEFPAGYTLSAMLDVKNIEPKSVLRLDCAEDVGTPALLHVGEQNAVSSLQQLSQDQLFLSYDTNTLPAGCTLQAVIDNGRGGRSLPATLAHMIRLPQIASFQLAAFQTGSEAAPEGVRSQAAPESAPSHILSYVLTGSNLEMIAKVGWDQDNGIDVAVLPTPLPGPGQQQSLSVNLWPPPGPHVMLFVWLRGEKTGRATTVSAPPTKAAP